MITQDFPYTVTWELLPKDFALPDDPVDNILQPALAAALTESLHLVGKLPASAMSTTNYGICATLNGKMVVKAPDWSYIANLRVHRDEVFRSYTPQLQGDVPLIVMEFLSDTDGEEYSSKPTYPPGKWFFYEQILRVRYYAIFDLATGTLEVYERDETGRYQLRMPDERHRFWLSGLDLSLGVWQGARENLNHFWLRWWDEQDNLLPWAAERVEQEHQWAEQEHQRAERLLAQLRAANIKPEV